MSGHALVDPIKTVSAVNAHATFDSIHTQAQHDITISIKHLFQFEHPLLGLPTGYACQHVRNHQQSQCRHAHAGSSGCHGGLACQST
jgi:hypothetical protein